MNRSWGYCLREAAEMAVRALSGITSPNWGTRKRRHLTQFTLGAGVGGLRSEHEQIPGEPSPKPTVRFVVLLLKDKVTPNSKAPFLRGALPDPSLSSTSVCLQLYLGWVMV